MLGAGGSVTAREYYLRYALVKVIIVPSTRKGRRGQGIPCSEISGLHTTSHLLTLAISVSSVNRRRTCALFVDVASSAVAADAIRAALARRLRAAEPAALLQVLLCASTQRTRREHATRLAVTGLGVGVWWVCGGCVVGAWCACGARCISSAGQKTCASTTSVWQRLPGGRAACTRATHALAAAICSAECG